MSREQIVRDTAYAIWEAEGRPEGRDAEHWRLAEVRVAASLADKAPKAKVAKASPKPKAPLKGKVEPGAAEAAPKAAAPLKAAATKAASKKKG